MGEVTLSSLVQLFRFPTGNCPHDDYRLVVFRWVSLLIGCLLALVAAESLWMKHVVFSLPFLLGSIGTFLLLGRVSGSDGERNRDRLARHAWLLLVICFAFFLVLATVGRPARGEQSEPVWGFCFTVVSFALVDRRSAFWWNVAFFAVGGGLVLLLAFLSPVSLNVVYSIDLLASFPLFLVVFFVSYLAALCIERQEALLFTRLFRDELTGLPNDNRLQFDLANRGPCTLGVFNIDNFKDLTEFSGPEAAQFIIVELAQRLTRLFGARAVDIYRLHGDEFAITFDGSHDRREVEQLMIMAQKVCENMPFTYAGTPIFITLSAGVASGNQGLLERTYLALKIAKREKKSIVWYEEGLESVRSSRNDLQTIGALRQALIGGRLRLVYQPIVNTATGRVEKYECLVRMIGEDGRPVPPGQFLRAAHLARLYPDVTRFVIKTAFSRFRDVDAEFSINLSYADLANRATVLFLRHQIEAFPAPQRVVLELTESADFEDMQLTSDFCQMMKNLGCRIAIDDFGSGYSNYITIVRLPLDYLKIDGSLIKTIATDASCRSVVENVHGFARRLGLKTIAEYIHDEATFTTVRTIGIDFAQGYYLGPPSAELASSS